MFWIKKDGVEGQSQGPSSPKSQQPVSGSLSGLSPRAPKKNVEINEPKYLLIHGWVTNNQLGIQTSAYKDGKGVLVTGVEEGVVGTWNSNKNNDSVLPGDLLVGIGSAPHLMDDLRGDYTRSLTLLQKHHDEEVFLQFLVQPEAAKAKANSNYRKSSSAMHIWRAARGLVSKKKKRFQQDEFDLDLSYITPRIIAMGYPSEGAEGIFRNPMAEVRAFFIQYHDQHFKIYNLCLERKYPFGKFEEIGGKVAEYPFEDHNAPPFNLLPPLCEDIDAFLRADERNIVSLHCKAGKGRTGTAICSYLVYAGDPSPKALALFGEQRTKNAKGVTIPSQRRYVIYFEQYLKEHGPERPLRPIEAPPMKLTHLIIHTLPKISDGGCTPFLQIFGSAPESQLLYDHKAATHGNPTGFYGKNINHITLPLMVIVQGDIKFQFFDAGKNKKEKTKMFHFWINTYFLKFSKNHVFLEKGEVDKAFKDKHHKKYDSNFAVELFFEVPNSQELEELLHATEEPNPSSGGSGGSVREKYDAAHPPPEEELNAEFIKFIDRSNFSPSAIESFKNLTPQAKWSLILQDQAVGGTRTSLALPKTMDPKRRVAPGPMLGTVSEKEPKGAGGVMSDPDEEDNEEEDNDDDYTWAEASEAYKASNKGERHQISFKAGDLIRVIRQEEDWWYGECNGATGYFPAALVSVVHK